MPPRRWMVRYSAKAIDPTEAWIDVASSGELPCCADLDEAFEDASMRMERWGRRPADYDVIWREVDKSDKDARRFKLSQINIPSIKINSIEVLFETT